MTAGQLSLPGLEYFCLFVRVKTTPGSQATASQSQFRKEYLIGRKAYNWTTPNTIPRENATIITTAPCVIIHIILHQ